MSTKNKIRNSLMILSMILIVALFNMPVRVQASSPDQEQVATYTDAVWESSIHGTPTLEGEKTINDVYEIVYYILLILLIWFTIWAFIKVYNWVFS